MSDPSRNETQIDELLDFYLENIKQVLMEMETRIRQRLIEPPSKVRFEGYESKEPTRAELRTGLIELMYGQSIHQFRSASEAQQSKEPTRAELRAEECQSEHPLMGGQTITIAADSEYTFTEEFKRENQKQENPVQPLPKPEPEHKINFREFF